MRSCAFVFGAADRLSRQALTCQVLQRKYRCYQRLLGIGTRRLSDMVETGVMQAVVNVNSEFVVSGGCETERRAGNNNNVFGPPAAPSQPSRYDALADSLSLSPRPELTTTYSRRHTLPLRCSTLN